MPPRSLRLAVLIVSLALIVVFSFPLWRSSAADNKGKSSQTGRLAQDSPVAKQRTDREGPANYDAFGASNKRTATAATAAGASGPSKMETGHAVQTEPRLGVPTFLWASETGQGQARQLSSVQADAKVDIESAARGHLGNNASTYRLSSDDVATVKLVAIHDTGKGAIIAKFKQELGGIEVFRDQINVIMNRNLQLVALSGYITGDNTGVSTSATDFKLQPVNAVSTALQDLTGTTVNTSVLQSRGTKPSTSEVSATAGNDQNPYLLFTADKAATQVGANGFTFAGEPARVKKVMFHLVDGYVPAYYVETDILVPSTDAVTVSGEANPTEWGYSYVISAVDGQVLFRKNLIDEAGGTPFTYRVWADPATRIPFDTPAGNDVEPKVNATPDGVQFPFAALSDITLTNYPFSRNDPWLDPGATETVGNNADAYVDLFDPDGFNPIAAPADPATGDFRAQITAAGQFLHTHTPDADPALAEARQGAIQQLFYNVNFLHDWFYDAGFDETAGNAQASNYGRGGVQNDRLRAEAQDVSGRNNANMLTPADGTSPRMQMYLFDSNNKYLDVLSPGAAAGQRSVGTGTIGPQMFDLTNQVVQPSPADGCTLASFTGTAGKFVLVDYEPTSGPGFCAFTTKLDNAKTAGAAGFILVYNSSTPNSLVNVTGSLPSFTIPFLSITWNGAASIKTELASANTVTARMFRGADRDGAIDNQIVFHEWGHYISNRLIGNSAGLNTNLSRGMGEGWADFNAMLALTVRPDDISIPSNANWNGVYALADYATSGGNKNGYYFGIRRYPYSTDMTKDPLTFKHIQDGQTLPVGPPVNSNGAVNSEVHNTGEVWATMLWECYASLLRDTVGPSPRLTFREAQERMKYYIVASYKMTPNQPTFLEARDAVLAAAKAYDTVDYVLFVQAFAKRGAGVGAVSPDRFTLDNVGVTESFEAIPEAIFTGASLADSVSSCDNDGVLDSGETGKLVINLKNIGSTTLAGTTATVTSTTPGVTLPNGNTINFPSFDPLGTSSASAVVALGSGIAGQQSLDFQISYSDPQLAGSPRTVNASFRGNTNEIPASTATDTVESPTVRWTATSVPPTGTITTPWRRKEVSAMQHVWHVDDIGLSSDERLTSPVFTVSSGSFNIQFDHSWGFEFNGSGNYDGGVIEMSVNGGAWTDIGGPNYNGTIVNNDPNPLKGRNAFVQNSGGTVHTSFTQAIAPGSTVRIRFRVGSDGAVGSSGWDVDNIAFTGVVETPFTTLVADTGSCPIPPPTPVQLQLTPNALPSGTVNSLYPTTDLVPSGGTGPYSYNVTPFALPQGLNHDVVGGNLQISGTPTHGGTFPVTIAVNDSAGHQRSFSYPITINKIDPGITWNDPADITYGTALSSTQLNASVSVPGTITYTPTAGTQLNAGAAQALTVNFVPTDPDTYASTSKTVHINVLKATPTITWANPADIVYGNSLSATQLNATASVPGTLTYTPPIGTTLNAGNNQTLTVNFTPTDTANYSGTSKSVQINVLKAKPVITWSNPADIVYGTNLGATQLNATANVSGAFTYTPASGVALNAGNNQTLSVDFTPADAANYSNVSKSVAINVTKAAPVITWNNPADITYLTALSNTQLNATASVAGTLSYVTPVGTVLNAGANQTLTVNFTPTDASNYGAASKDVTINVLKAAPVINWSNPADITLGTPLSATQLNATASVPGSFTYLPSLGTILGVGNNQSLSVGFTPTDTANYSSTSKTVTINTLKADQTITFGALVNRNFGDAPFDVTATASSNLPVSFQVFSGPASISGNTVTLTGSGTVVIRASQAGDGNYNAAAPVDQSFTVGCASTVVTNGSDSGVGSLRDVISNACAGSTITFNIPTSDPGYDSATGVFKVTLTSGTLQLNQNVTISGTGANVLNITRSTAPATGRFPIFDVAAGVTANISGVTVSNGDCASNGGGIVNAGTLSLIADTLTGNHTDAGGSAIFNTGTGTLTVSRSTVNGNSSSITAAIYNQNGTLTLTDSTITANASQSNVAPGGAVFSDVNGDSTVTNCTIYQNTGSTVAVFHNIGGTGATKVKNSIVAGNTGGDVSNIQDQGNNLIGGNPLLGPLANYGGTTMTLALLPGSPAIDAGTSTGAPTQDQRGVSRIGAVDIGAFESRGFTINVQSGNNQTTPISSAFTSSLAAKTSSVFGEPVAGGQVTFTGPSSGTGAVLGGSGSSAVAAIDNSGLATVSAVANGSAGGYAVAATASGAGGTATFSLTNGKGSQSITSFPAIGSKTFGDAAFNVSAVTSSGLPVSFSIISGPATVSGSTVTLTGAGTVVIRALQPGDNDYNPAAPVDQSFIVSKATASVTLGNLSQIYDGSGKNASATTSPAALTVTFTYDGAAQPPVNAGSYQVVGTISDANYQGSATGTLVISKATPVITWANPADITYGVTLGSTQLNAAANIQGNFTYLPAAGTKPNAGVGQTLSVIFTPTDSANYTTASKSVSVNVLKANQTITFGALTGNTYGDAPFTVSATASSGLNVAFNIVSGPATVSGNTITITGAGTVVVRASQGGDSNFNAAASVDQGFTVAKANQTITFGALANKTYGDPPFTVNATSSSGLNVTFSIVSGPATISGNTVTITGAGTVVVRGSQGGDSNYNAAILVDVSLTVAKASQTITFGVLGNKAYGDPPFSAIATASSGLTVTFSIVSGPATVTGGTVTITGPGTIVVRASQAGDSNYNAATAVDRSVTVAQAASTTTVASSQNPSEFGQGVTFTATVSSTAGTPTGSVQFKDGGSNLGSQVALSGGKASASFSSLSSGNHNITAVYSGDTNFVSSTGTLQNGQTVNGQVGVSINDSSVTEGDSGTKGLTFTVTLSAASLQTVSVNYQTADGTATVSDSDYQAASGTLTFNPGETNKTVTVQVNGDVRFEADETFSVNLSNPVNSAISDNQGLGTVLNDDVQGGIIKFKATDYSVLEADGQVVLTVTRTGDTSSTASVDYTSTDVTAKEQADYSTAVGTLKFAAGETSKTITVLINEDLYVEGTEIFTVTLNNPAGGSVLASPSTATVQINDNDTTQPKTNIIDDASAFVRQQYHDFLGREPDAGGLGYWTGEITKCGSDQTCIRDRRIDVSVAFFMEQEFQQTGFYVYKVFKASNGRAPLYIEYMRGRNEVLGGPNLAQQQADYAVEQVSPAYTGKTNAEYVDQLYQNAGVTPSSTERDALVNGLDGGTETRGSVLQKVAGNQTFTANEKNAAFVLAEYFGYLRRDPEPAGFQFWLDVLNNKVPGNFRSMVCAFITSAEYQERFSSVVAHTNQECQ